VGLRKWRDRIHAIEKMLHSLESNSVVLGSCRRVFDGEFRGGDGKDFRPGEPRLRSANRLCWFGRLG
jgi:hypothetical protein